jgi:hypothetical protein
VIEPTPGVALRSDQAGSPSWTRSGSLNPIQPPTPPPQARG